MATKTPVKKVPAKKPTARERAATAKDEATKVISKAKTTAKTSKKEPEQLPKKLRKVNAGIDLISMYSDKMDVIAKRQGIETSSLDVSPPMSTGLLCVDMMLGGGARACMLTGAGNEQCAKTTLALVAMAAAIKEMIPIIAFWDFEGSTKNSKPYVASILKTCGINLSIDQIFGRKDKKTGKWITPPRVRYSSQTILERFYDWLSEILRDLPDKRFIENDWWLIFEDNKKQGTRQKLGDQIDAGMTRKYGGGLWVKAPDDKMQALIFVDSYTAMQPKIKDEEEIGNQFSVKASAFSKQLERVKGRMADKMVMIWGLNHLRQNPGQVYGPKETEKGGEALKQFSDVRIRQTSRSDSAHPFKAGMVTNKKFKEVEPSVEYDGKDTYRLVHLKTVKNKLWTPERETFMRIWVQDGGGVARGIDPVFDTMMFLKETGQITGSRKAMKLKFGDHGTSKVLTWQDLKLWILGSKEQMIQMSKKAGYPAMNLRSMCFKQIKSGVAEDKYVENMNEKSKSGSDDDSDSDED
jgi:RecA/RadA recombinase